MLNHNMKVQIGLTKTTLITEVLLKKDWTLMPLD